MRISLKICHKKINVKSIGFSICVLSFSLFCINRDLLPAWLLFSFFSLDSLYLQHVLCKQFGKLHRGNVTEHDRIAYRRARWRFAYYYSSVSRMRVRIFRSLSWHYCYRCVGIPKRSFTRLPRTYHRIFVSHELCIQAFQSCIWYLRQLLSASLNPDT